MKKRNNYPDSFKAKIALEAIKGDLTLTEISSKYSVHSTQINRWKKQVLEKLPGIFSDKVKKIEQNHDQEKDELFKQIGQLKVELDWLKKKIWT